METAPRLARPASDSASCRYGLATFHRRRGRRGGNLSRPMARLCSVAVTALAVALGCAATSAAQRAPDPKASAKPPAPPPGKASWPTDGYDVQRTSWQRHETLISPAS